MDSLHTVANDFLTRIIGDKSTEIAERRVRISADLLEGECACVPPAIPVAGYLQSDRLRVIAEVKRGSPSAGVFNARLDAAEQAAAYAGAGAAAVSVLTDGPHFGGSLDDLIAARRLIDVPLLRKDFIIDTYQLLEARANGADIVLLIVAALEPSTLRLLLEKTASLGMSALVEVNTAAEAEVAMQAGATLLGVNNRNLHTFEVDMETTARIRPLLAGAAIVASLSGIRTPDDARAMREAGADAVLVGEALIRSADPAALIASMSAIA